METAKRESRSFKPLAVDMAGAAVSQHGHCGHSQGMSGPQTVIRHPHIEPSAWIIVQSFNLQYNSQYNYVQLPNAVGWVGGWCPSRTDQTGPPVAQRANSLGMMKNGVANDSCADQRDLIFQIMPTQKHDNIGNSGNIPFSQQ